MGGFPLPKEEELLELTSFDAVKFGRRVAERRKKQQIKQFDLAGRIGVSQSHMSGIELGKDQISFEVFLKLCVALQVNPDYLLGGTLILNNIPKTVADNLNKCSEEDQQLVSDIIDLLKKRAEERS